MNKKIRIGIIGTFWLTDEFIKAIKMSEEVEYYAQYSRDPEKAASYGKQHGARVYYSDIEDMANDSELDAVYIAVPNMLHYKYSKLFLSAKKHVICEKPITVTVDEFDELSSIAKENNLIYMEAMMNIHVSWASIMKQELADLGSVVVAKLDFNQRSSKLDRINRGEMFSSFDKECCGGALMDLGIYCTSLATYLFGMPNGVSATGHFSENGADLADTVVLEYGNFECIFTISKLCESVARSEILCTDGAITFKNVSQLQMCKLIKDSKEKIIHGTNSFPESMIYEINNFVSYIKDRNNENRLLYEKNTRYTRSSLQLLEKIRNDIGYQIESEK